MSEGRIENIQKRMEWLRIELQHRNYWDGYTTKGFEDELTKLILELENLKTNLKK